MRTGTEKKPAGKIGGEPTGQDVADDRKSRGSTLAPALFVPTVEVS